MTSAFDRAFKRLVGVEGGFSNDPSDTGGATKYGITEAVARDHGYMGDMASLPLDTAKAIAKAQYWDLLMLDQIAQISDDIAEELFEIGYNMGTARAGRFLQIVLNIFNRRGTLFSDVKVDGVVGPRTVAALRRYIGLRGVSGELVAMRALNSLQGAAYIDLAQKREKDEDFVYGWILKRVQT